MWDGYLRRSNMDCICWKNPNENELYLSGDSEVIISITRRTTVEWIWTVHSTWDGHAMLWTVLLNRDWEVRVNDIMSQANRIWTVPLWRLRNLKMKFSNKRRKKKDTAFFPLPFFLSFFLSSSVSRLSRWCVCVCICYTHLSPTLCDKTIVGTITYISGNIEKSRSEWISKWQWANQANRIYELYPFSDFENSK